MSASWCSISAIHFDPNEKVRVDKNRFKSPTDTHFKVSSGPAGRVERKESLKVLLCHRPPIRATSQICENPPHARNLVPTGGTAYENPVAAGGLLRRRRLEG